MNRPPPNLNDPAELAAYRRELRALVPWVRYTGMALALLGAAIAVLWPQLPGALPLAVIALGFAMMVAAIGIRTRYHARRMRGDA
ncbi:hypothetical protein QH494_13010 [Sphingomonas sp. AR_OL41]|uniref:hypothetical protein n=1 Tax=Sphingomonas sp. AR_OL41 TaxID=3042729 RepID=UPI00247FF5F6|nr:hypothetical protein [Sphingomonas sp. AR_OL41]MDH7973101.1 hypothetical protein [Sphingomonas sp. AR_OL41]